jgi:hypothetical protein
VIVFERWYGQGNETGGLHRRARIDPTCQMVVRGVACGRPATERVNEIAMGRRYPSSFYWCPDHAALVRGYA